jgi:hypothetical protein
MTRSDKNLKRKGFIFVYVFPAFLLYFLGILSPNIIAVNRKHGKELLK